jgi:serine/threonine protein phosphatase 1
MIKVREFTSHTYYPNKLGRDFVTGDLHGMYDLFMKELDNIGFNTETDRCFSVGDLIDRGPNSANCLWLSKVKWFIPTYGNHEDLFLQAIAGKDHYMDLVWHQNGGDWAKYESDEDIKDLLDIARSLPYIITLNHKSGKKIGICHAQSPTTDWNDIDALTETEIQASIWGRTVATGKAPVDYWVKNVDWCFHGHTPMNDPLTVGNCTFIDTGAVLPFYLGDTHKGKLTIICIDDFIEENKNG